MWFYYTYQKTNNREILLLLSNLEMYHILLIIIYFLSFFAIIYPKKYKVWFLEQKKIFKNFKPNVKKTIWIHCSSLGEYEQIKALIIPLKKINTHINITFFSPSGYKYFKDFDTVEQISYLPLDLKYRMRKFIDLINPMMVIIAKNDVWPNMITCLSDKKIPLYLIGCKIKSQKTNNWLSKYYYKKYFSKFSHIFCEDSVTDNFLKSNKIAESSIIQNTRINQVLIDSKNEFNNQKIDDFTKNWNTIIYGSIEKSDINIIIHTINNRKDLKHIIVPHEINDNIIYDLQKIISNKHILYSELKHHNVLDENILIIDKFGILKKIYQYSNIAYIGGGFNQGVHNTLEPSVYGNLILFGPQYLQFPEILFFLQKKTAFSIKNRSEFEQQLNTLLKNSHSRDRVLKITSSFFHTKDENVASIISKIKEHIQIP